VQTPDHKTSIPRCETASLFAQDALREYPAVFKAEPELAAQLENLANTLGVGTGALLAAQSTYRAAVVALVPHRVRVKLVDLRSAEVVHSVKRAAEEAGEEVAEAVFPGGVTPVIKGYGQSEVAALRALEGRIAAATRWADREAQLARIVEVRELYEKALKDREEAMIDAAAKRAIRNAVKEDFLDVFATVAAAIEGKFPRDRRRQNVFFDKLRAKKAADEDHGDEDDGDDEV
jgi:hypothetical protein